MVPAADPDIGELTLETLRVRVAQLQHALDSRIVIEQAKGILAERHGISLDEAFHMLRQHCRRRRINLHVGARAVTTGRLKTLDAIQPR